ncbi:hypothetical protein HPB48_018791 [Haemaphysalis longicornis]|uniref:Chitinase II/V-like catalytic domain-containing protein n=1 Tax=Haemaphysalis longicornis TaxID=44386 RepID=A0A9J6G3L2_HAELO|nr:hypothetical protein HPB48_018791 [Haemaphysalis longicornis]
MASPSEGTDFRPPPDPGRFLQPPGVFRLGDDPPVIPVIKVAPPPGARTSHQSGDIFVMLSPTSPRQREDPISNVEPEHTTSFESGVVVWDEPAHSDGRPCLRLWVLCGVVAIPLVLSSWLIVIPWLVDISNRPPAPIPTTSSTTPWAADVPASCRVHVARHQTNLRVGPEFSRGPTTRKVGPIFCFFEPLEVGAKSHWGFMFETLPFELCPNVIYSSLGIENGILQSRMPPDYDEKYGLHQLRNIADTLGFNDTKILVALGGYPEDAPHFSRLAREPATLDMLVESVLPTMRACRLDGVVLNWAPPLPNCPRGGEIESFVKLIDRLHIAFKTNNLDLSLSVILDADAVDIVKGTTLPLLVNHVFVFVSPNTTASPLTSLTDHCEETTSDLHNALRRYSSFVPRDKICIVENVGPLYYHDASVLLNVPYTGERRGFYESCTQVKFCRAEHLSGVCIVHSKQNMTTLTFEHFVVPSELSLQSRLNLDSIYQPAAPQAIPTCILVTGLHYDNFVHQCPVDYNRYLLTLHLVYSANGWAEPVGSVLSAAPKC